MKFIQFAFVIFLSAAAFNIHANPGQYQINQACLSVGCFPGDNPATKTVEITQSSGTFVLTSSLTFTASDNGNPAIIVNHVTNHSAITIDLNGYEIRHDGVADSSTNGIVIQGQNSTVTVKNGKVAAFNDGIQVQDTATLVVENMVFRINRDDAVQSGKGIIRNSVFDANRFGVFAVDATGNESGDRLYLKDNLFLDDSGEQDAFFGFANSNYCKDNVIAYEDTGEMGACTLSGSNLCDTSACSSGNNIHQTESKE